MSWATIFIVFFIIMLRSMWRELSRPNQGPHQCQDWGEESDGDYDTVNYTPGTCQVCGKDME